MAGAALAPAAAGCSRTTGQEPGSTEGASDGSPQAPPEGTVAAASHLVDRAPLVSGDRGAARSAVRCGECHGALHVEWARSDHARSNRSSMYLAMRQGIGRAACDPCHAPLASLHDPGDTVVGEGTTCEVCHAIKDMDLTAPRARLDLNLAENIQWGTLCETQEHYFHKAGCAPVFQSSRLCGGCHRWSVTLPSGRAIRILPEYDEWLESPAAAAGVLCQGCHMPRTRGEVATGWKRLSPIGHHGMMGAGGDLRRGAVSMKLAVGDQQGALHAEVTVKNEGNGHAAPTGLPGRQIVLRVIALDAEGRELERAERIYERVLVDAAGKEVPFHAAQAEASDNRLGPGEVRRESFSFAAPGVDALSAELLWRRASPALAAALGIEVEERSLSDARVPVRPPASRQGRPHPSKAVTATPPAPPAPP